jgi:hypothetical protein
MMSSETSTRRPSNAGSRTRATRQDEPGPGASIQPVHLLIIGVVACASVGVILAHGASPASLVLTALAVVAVGGTTAALFRTLWPLASDAPLSEPEMLGGRTRAALEREKTIVLRAIKELEFDRAMGKVSEADCEEMTGRLRARAGRLTPADSSTRHAVPEHGIAPSRR